MKRIPIDISHNLTTWPSAFFVHLANKHMNSSNTSKQMWLSKKLISQCPKCMYIHSYKHTLLTYAYESTSTCICMYITVVIVAAKRKFQYSMSPQLSLIFYCFLYSLTYKYVCMYVYFLLAKRIFTFIVGLMFIPLSEYVYVYLCM